MRHRECASLTAGALLAALTGAAAASDADNTDLARRLAELEARDAANATMIAALRSEVASLKAQTGDGWLTEQRSEEIRALVQDTLADADTRASLLQSGAVAGWDNGFFIASPDGNFRLNIKGMIQFRHVWSIQDNSPEDNSRAGFELSRTRLGFAGHVVDPTWKYFVWHGWTSSGSSLLLDCWISKDLGDGWSLQVGQFKTLTWYEWTLSETRQQFVERSNLDARYGGLYTQGVQAHYTGDNLRLQLAFTDGLRTWNTPYNTGPGATTGTMPYQLSTEYAFSARAEFLLTGAWSQYADFESWKGEEPMCVIGVAAHYQDGEYGTVDDESELFQWTVDGSFEFGGANLYAALIGNHIENSTIDRDEYGFLIQGGFFLNEDWELMARYEWGDLDGAGTVGDDLSIMTLGVSRFWNRHGIKFTADVGYAFNGIDAAWGGASRGWRADALDEDGQLVIRNQFQLLF